MAFEISYFHTGILVRWSPTSMDCVLCSMLLCDNIAERSLILPACQAAGEGMLLGTNFTQRMRSSKLHRDCMSVSKSLEEGAVCVGRT